MIRLSPCCLEIWVALWRTVKGFPKRFQEYTLFEGKRLSFGAFTMTWSDLINTPNSFYFLLPRKRDSVPVVQAGHLRDCFWLSTSNIIDLNNHHYHYLQRFLSLSSTLTRILPKPTLTNKKRSRRAAFQGHLTKRKASRSKSITIRKIAWNTSKIFRPSGSILVEIPTVLRMPQNEGLFFYRFFKNSEDVFFCELIGFGKVVQA